MANEKKPEVLKLEELNELDDELLESINGGLAVQKLGPTNLSGIKTGQKLPEDTGFGKSRRP